MYLYEIPNQLRCALDAIEVDEETGEILGAHDLDEIEGEARHKIEGAGLYLRELTAEAEAIGEEAARLTQRRRSVEKRIERIKALMLPAVDALGGKVKGSMLTVSIGTTKSVALTENALDLLPDDFVRVKREVDKTAIGAALKAGTEVPGACLVENRSIRMR